MLRQSAGATLGETQKLDKVLCGVAHLVPFKVEDAGSHAACLMAGGFAA